MANISLADKLKIIFSPEKGKDILNFAYKNVIEPNIRNTLFIAGQTMLARMLNIDDKNIPTINTSYTSYSSIGKGVHRSVDVTSFLPSTSIRGDISSIGFKTAIEAMKLVDFMDKCIKGPLGKCRVTDVYEHLIKERIIGPMPISSSDCDIGWKTTQNICVLERNGLYYLTAPKPESLV